MRRRRPDLPWAQLVQDVEAIAKNPVRRSYAGCGNGVQVVAINVGLSKAQEWLYGE